MRGTAAVTRLRLRVGVDRYGDAALAAALTLFTQADIWGAGDYLVGSKWLFAFTTLCMTVPLAWRRRAPFAVAAVVSAALVLQILVEPSPHPPDAPFLAWIVTSYSVAAHASLRNALAGGALLIVAVDAWAYRTGDDLVFVPVILAGFWIAGRVVRSRNVLAETLAERTRELEHEREENARLAVAEERTRIARELHDAVAHSVSVMVVNAGAERLALGPGRESTRDVLRSIEETGREALGEMGRLVTMLRIEGDPELEPQPSLQRVDALVRRVREAGLAVELVVHGEQRPLPAGVDASAYRIVQEGLTNVIRHAAAARARVTLTFGARELGLEVADDGVGPSANGRRAGHGLVGIRERASLYGGDVTVGRSDLGGYRVSARLPLPP